MSNEISVIHFKLPQGLQTAFESIIMPPVDYGRGWVMPKAVEKLTAEERAAALDPFSNPEAFKSLWTKGAALGQKKAVEENDRLGIDSHGTVDGRLALKTPSGEVKFIKKFDI